MTKKRISWIDIAKALTIFLVVFGHTIRGGTLQKIVYIFHVPTFFFLAGMTCRIGKGRIQKDFKTIMVPYYIWGMISIVVFVLLGKVAGSSLSVDVDTNLFVNLYGLLFASPKTHHMRFNLPLWFLPCLFITKVEFYGLKKYVKKDIFILYASMVLSALGFGYTAFVSFPLPFAIEISWKLLPFFILGHIFNANKDKIEEKSRFFLYTGAAVFLTLTCIIGLISEKVNYNSDLFPNVPLFYLGSIFGCAFVVCLSIALNRQRYLEFIGQQTLPILVMHKFPILFFQILPPIKKWIQNPDSIVGILSSLIVSILAIVLCLFVYSILMRFLPILFGEKGRELKLD